MKKRLKKKYIIIAIVLVLVLAIAAVVDFKIHNDQYDSLEGLAEYLLVGALFLFGAPIIGSLLLLRGLHVWNDEGGEINKEHGEIAAMVWLVICIVGGPALILALPVIAIIDAHSQITSYIVGILLLAVQIAISFGTILIHGGSEKVQATKLGGKIQSCREKWKDRLF